MSRIAAEAGIGRVTLYKYFPDVEAVLAARPHRRQRAAGPDAVRRLLAVTLDGLRSARQTTRIDGDTPGGIT
jgi:AcrR family transcriptional regulator